MKRTRKKLMLNKETLRRLNADDLRWVVGGDEDPPDSVNTTSCPCPGSEVSNCKCDPTNGTMGGGNG